MWKLYDELIEKIPEQLTVERFVIGKYRTAVYAAGYVGLASTVHNYDGNMVQAEKHVGKNLRQMASLIKSWDFTEASLGLAALNSYYNRLETLEAHVNSELLIRTDADAFDYYENIVEGKKVAVIGHFLSLDSKMKKAASLAVIEREPKEGDFPDTAAEYLLPDRDFVFITAMTLQNKTLPLLLELSKNARIILMGPSLVMSESLFKYGVETLSGFCVTNPVEAFASVEKGANKEFYKWGEKIIFKAP